MRVGTICCEYIKIEIVTVHIVVMADVAANTNGAGLAEWLAIHHTAANIIEVVINALAIGTEFHITYRSWDYTEFGGTVDIRIVTEIGVEIPIEAACNRFFPFVDQVHEYRNVGFNVVVRIGGEHVIEHLA
jgi:hypothetical protein